MIDKINEFIAMAFTHTYISMLLGAPALTSRGLKEDDFTKVVGFLDEAISIGKKAQTMTGIVGLNCSSFTNVFLKSWASIIK